MSLPAAYRALLQEKVREPSRLVALLRGGGEELPGLEGCLARLERSRLRVRHLRAARGRGAWSVGLELAPAHEGAGYAARLELVPTRKPEAVGLEWSRLGRSELVAAEQSTWSLALELELGPAPLEGFHEQVRALVAAAAGECVVMVDENACMAYSGRQARDMAECRVPPAPQSLYTVHSVYERDALGSPLWLHTHGLRRCGSVELEVLGVRLEHGPALAGLVNALAPRFAESVHVPPPGEPFEVGEGLEVAWLPWEQGLQYMEATELGGVEEREGLHGRPSGLLVVPGPGGRWRSLAALVPVLERRPLLYLSPQETQRLGLMARERLEHFAALHAAHGSEPGWSFLVKLGYPMQGQRQVEGEHLWFMVHALGGSRVEATLVSAPRWVRGLRVGERGRYPLSEMTDWAVLSPLGRYGPDEVLELVRGLKAPEDTLLH